jgi:long-chain fatty acid transport protein
MKSTTLPRAITAALAACSASAFAGGLDRSFQDISALYENGTYAEFKLGYVKPKISGIDVASRDTEEIGKAFVLPGLAYKQNFGQGSSFALIIDRPIGADTVYAPAASGGSPVLGGTFGDLVSTQLTALVRQKSDNGFGVHAGLRAEQVEASLRLGGQAFGGLNGYGLSVDSHTGLGYVFGGTYERPDIAMRVALTYHSPINHNLSSRETTPIGPITGKFSIDTPQSWNLTAQSGVAANTVVFAGIRWAEWSSFKIVPPGFTTLTRGTAPNGIVRLDDVSTYTLGVGQRFTPAFTGLATVSYEERLGRLKTPIAPVDGFLTLTLGAVYRVGNFSFTGGVSARRYGDASAETGGAARAKFADNTLTAIGIKVGYEFK